MADTADRAAATTPAKRRPRSDEERATAAELAAAMHELSERLTALGNYLAVMDRVAGPGDAGGCAEIPLSGRGIVGKALAQAAQAGEAMRGLRTLLAAEPPAARKRRRPAYRVSFLNEFVVNGRAFRPCQRSIVIRSAHSREAAIEAAKKRFARLEGIPEWNIHAGMIEVVRVDDPETADADLVQRHAAAPESR